MPESVSFSTSRVWAIMVSQVPVCEISWPKKNSRKLRMCSERNVSFAAREMRRLTGGLGDLGAQALEHVDGVEQPLAVAGRQAFEAGLQPGGAHAADLFEVPSAGCGAGHPGDAAVVGV